MTLAFGKVLVRISWGAHQMSTPPTTSPAAFFGRLAWIVVGPMALTVLALGIAQQDTGWFTGFDLAFFLVLGGMLFGRWLEFQSGGATTSTGEPATPADLRRYLMTATPVGLGLWVLVNLAGNYWLGG